MRSKRYMLAVFLLAAALALGQSKEHEKAHADHMEAPLRSPGVGQEL
jgi:hypothetical protein